MRFYLTLFIVVAICSVGAYFFTQENSSQSTQDTNPACKELTPQELQTIASTFLKKKGYTEEYYLTDVSPLYCDKGVGIRNMVAEGTIDSGLPSQHNRTVRIQMRADSTELKVYEVVLANPT